MIYIFGKSETFEEAMLLKSLTNNKFVFIGTGQKTLPSKNDLNQGIIILNGIFLSPRENQALFDAYKQCFRGINPISVVLVGSQISASNWHAALRLGIRHIFKLPGDPAELNTLLDYLQDSKSNAQVSERSNNYNTILNPLWTEKTHVTPFSKARSLLKNRSKIIWLKTNGHPLLSHQISVLLFRPTLELTNEKQANKGLEGRSFLNITKIEENSIQQQHELEKNLKQTVTTPLIIQSRESPEKLLSCNKITDYIYENASQSVCDISELSVNQNTVKLIAEWYLWSISNQLAPQFKLASSSINWLHQKLPLIGWYLFFSCLDYTWREKKLIHIFPKDLELCLEETLLADFDEQLQPYAAYIDRSKNELLEAAKHIKNHFDVST